MKTKFYVSALLLILFGIIVSGQETKEKWVEERTNEVIKENNKGNYTHVRTKNNKDQLD